MTEPIYVCPACGSDRVTTEHIKTIMVYTGGHFSHIVKPHDSDSPATCLDCEWTGERRDLKLCCAMPTDAELLAHIKKAVPGLTMVNTALMVAKAALEEFGSGHA